MAETSTNIRHLFTTTRTLELALSRDIRHPMMKGYEYQSEFAKKYVAQGEATANARAVLTVLRVRGIAVSDAARERIQAEKDSAQLERWLEKATVAASVAEVLDEPS